MTIYDELKVAVRKLQQNDQAEAARALTRAVYAAPTVVEARSIMRIYVPSLYRIRGE